MNLFAPISSWWRALAHRSQTDSDVEDELQFHIEVHANHLIDSGILPAEAMRQAKVEFGRVDVQKEKYGAAIGLRPLYEIGGDIRYGIRSLYRHPWISVAASFRLLLVSARPRRCLTSSIRRYFIRFRMQMSTAL